MAFCLCISISHCLIFLCREETAVYSGVGSVFAFDSTTQNWTPVDAGLSGVFIYHHPVLNTYRVIGVAQVSQQARAWCPFTAPHASQFVLNSTILADTASQRNNDQFCSWRDAYAVNGVNFAQKEQADEFMKILDIAKEAAAAAAGTSVAATDASITSAPVPDATQEATAPATPAQGRPPAPDAPAGDAGPAVPITSFLESAPLMPGSTPQDDATATPAVITAPDASPGSVASTPRDKKVKEKKEKKPKEKKEKKDKEARALEKKKKKEEREKQLKEQLDAEMLTAAHVRCCTFPHHAPLHAHAAATYTCSSAHRVLPAPLTARVTGERVRHRDA